MKRLLGMVAAVAGLTGAVWLTSGQSVSTPNGRAMRAARNESTATPGQVVVLGSNEVYFATLGGVGGVGVTNLTTGKVPAAGSGTNLVDSSMTSTGTNAATAGTHSAYKLAATNDVTVNGTSVTDAAILQSGTISGGRMPAMSGDATSSAGSTALTLAASGVSAGTYGDGTHVAQITLDAKGRATAVTSVAITGVGGGGGGAVASGYANAGSGAVRTNVVGTNTTYNVFDSFDTNVFTVVSIGDSENVGPRWLYDLTGWNGSGGGGQAQTPSAAVVPFWKSIVVVTNGAISGRGWSDFTTANYTNYWQQFKSNGATNTMFTVWWGANDDGLTAAQDIVTISNGLKMLKVDSNLVTIFTIMVRTNEGATTAAKKYVVNEYIRRTVETGEADYMIDAAAIMNEHMFDATYAVDGTHAEGTAGVGSQVLARWTDLAWRSGPRRATHGTHLEWTWEQETASTTNMMRVQRDIYTGALLVSVGHAGDITATGAISGGGTVTPTSVNTFGNKTIATGPTGAANTNTISSRRLLTLQVDRASGTSATMATSDSTANGFGRVTFAGYGGSFNVPSTNVNFIEFSTTVPPWLDTSQDLKIEYLQFKTTGTQTGAVGFDIGMADIADSSPADPTTFSNWFTFSTGGALSSPAAGDVFTISNKTLTGSQVGGPWKSSLTPGHRIKIRMDRSDANTDPMELLELIISYVDTQ